MRIKGGGVLVALLVVLALALAASPLEGRSLVAGAAACGKCLAPAAAMTIAPSPAAQADEHACSCATFFGWATAALASLAFVISVGSSWAAWRPRAALVPAGLVPLAIAPPPR